jgi:hypothetical protein
LCFSGSGCVYLLHVPFGGRFVNLGLRFSGGLAWEIALLTMAVAVAVAVNTGF